MALAALRSRVAFVQMAIVTDLKLDRSERGFQVRADAGEAINRHGLASRRTNTFARMGYSAPSCCSEPLVLAAIQIACTTTIASVSPSMPNSLKFTHVASSKL